MNKNAQHKVQTWRKNLRSPTQVSRSKFLEFVLKNKESLEYPFEVL